MGKLQIFLIATLFITVDANSSTHQGVNNLKTAGSEPIVVAGKTKEKEPTEIEKVEEQIKQTDYKDDIQLIRARKLVNIKNKKEKEMEIEKINSEGKDEKIKKSRTKSMEKWMERTR